MSGRAARSLDRLAVDYSGPATLLGLESAADALLCGPWSLGIHWQGAPAEPLSPWQQTCWFSDQDADYLELAVRLAHGLRVERSILLAKRDRTAYLADAVLAPRAGRIDYCGSLPLAPGVRARAARQSRECRLAIGRARALVLPLALGEWRCDGRPGGLSIDGRCLRLEQQADSRRLLAPLWLDLDPRRIRRGLTWRRLTVARDRAAVADDLAVGFRIQVAASQWLVYRSLGPRGNRTLLGHNLSTEMLVGRFTRCGEVEKLVEIE